MRRIFTGERTVETVDETCQVEFHDTGRFYANSRARDRSSDSTDTFNPPALSLVLAYSAISLRIIRTCTNNSSSWRCWTISKSWRSWASLIGVTTKISVVVVMGSFSPRTIEDEERVPSVRSREPCREHRTRQRYACTCNRSRALNDKVGHPNAQLQLKNAKYFAHGCPSCYPVTVCSIDSKAWSKNERASLWRLLRSCWQASSFSEWKKMVSETDGKKRRKKHSEEHSKKQCEVEINWRFLWTSVRRNSIYLKFHFDKWILRWII